MTAILDMKSKKEINKTCYRDRIGRLKAPCPSHKNLNVKLFANADANAGGSTIALPGLRPDQLKRDRERENTNTFIPLHKSHSH